MLFETLKKQDPDVAQAISQELYRQQNQIEMIASENFTSLAVMAANASVMTNKYAEGYPGRRYYGGCGYVDIVEKLAQERVCQLFDCEYANVQPHSGTQANQAVFLAFLQPGDTILGMSLAHGGHLTHGSKVNMSGKWFNAVSYGTRPDDELIDYADVARLARAYKPKLIIAGGSAYPRIIDFQRFREIADEVGALLLVDMAHFAGLVAGGVFPNPFPHAHIVTSTTHKVLRGPRGGIILTNDPDLYKKINAAVFPGIQGGPLMHTIAAKAVAFGEALEPAFKDYAQQVVKNARALASALIERGQKLISGGTDSHLLLLDLTQFDFTGYDAEKALERSGITCNKNSVVNDKRPPMQTSGIRLGSAAATTRGLKEDDFRELGYWIDDVLRSQDLMDVDVVEKKIRSDVEHLCRRYPLYPELSYQL